MQLSAEYWKRRREDIRRRYAGQHGRAEHELQRLDSIAQLFTTVSDGVCLAVADALGYESGAVQLTDSIYGDLAAESIDTVDIVFRLEKFFDVEIPRRELFPEDDFLVDPVYVQKGVFTPLGLEKVKATMKFADLDELDKEPTVDRCNELVRVADFVRCVEEKIS